MILIIDNYDSFVYNIYQCIAENCTDIIIRRNDQVSIFEIETLKPSHIILSPGPKTPTHAGLCIEIIQRFHPVIPILGICLGHQAIAMAFSLPLMKLERVSHGKTTRINLLILNSKIHKGMPSQFTATRYHSLIVPSENVQDAFVLTAETPDHLVMGIEHKKYPLFGIQYHPESILTEFGKLHFKNFLEQ